MRGTAASAVVTFARMKCGPALSSAVRTAWVISSAADTAGTGAGPCDSVAPRELRRENRRRHDTPRIRGSGRGAPDGPSPGGCAVPGLADLDDPRGHEEGDGLHRPVHRLHRPGEIGLERIGAEYPVRNPE